MRILQRYIASSYVATFLLSLSVLTFVMTSGLLFKEATRLAARGVSVRLVLEFMASILPSTFTLSIPLAALIAALLLFGRLSADSEIAAMQACGVRVLRIIAQPLLIAGLLSVACLWINDRLGPDSHYNRRRMLREIGTGTALHLIEEGRWIQDFAGVRMWVGRRQGRTLHDIWIFDRTRGGMPREIRAARAEVQLVGNDLVLDMHEVRIDPFYEDRPGTAVADRWLHVIQDARRVRPHQRDEDDLYLWELIEGIRSARWKVADEVPEDILGHKVSRLRVQLHRRLVLSLASVCFVFIGAPLGIRAQRRESSIGIAISLLVAMVFYLFIMLAQELTRQPRYHPHLLLWIPVLACLFLGTVLIRRAE